MSHNASKVVMGVPRKSFKVVDNQVGTQLAGVALRAKSDGTLSVTLADGELLGISVGKDLSDAGRTSICRAGLAVPIRLTAAFTPVYGKQVHVSDTTGLAVASGAGATGTNATYASGPLTAILEDGTEVAAGAALVDMQGGL
jgi:hypothetical protein